MSVEDECGIEVLCELQHVVAVAEVSVVVSIFMWCFAQVVVHGDDERGAMRIDGVFGCVCGVDLRVAYVAPCLEGGVGHRGV